MSDSYEIIFIFGVTLRVVSPELLSAAGNTACTVCDACAVLVCVNTLNVRHD